MSRPALRGQGYMRKGGVPATKAHNARVRAAQEPPVVSVALAGEADARTDARGSASAGRATALPAWAWAAVGYVAGIVNALVVL